MTVTKEQIQALKAAAEKAIWGDWEDYKPHKGARGYEVKKGITAVAQHCLKDDAAYIAKASPKVILSLLAEREADKALIAEQAKSIDFLKEQLAQLANFNPDWDMLEAATDSLREHMAELTAANKRIAELEARTLTVKLPKPHAHLIWIQAGHGPDDYWDDVEVSRSEKDRCCDGSERYPVYSIFEIQDACAAAGITLTVGGEDATN